MWAFLLPDPLEYPMRREQSKRKAKGNGLSTIIQEVKNSVNGDIDEPNEFADSDTDPVWTPLEEKVASSLKFSYKYFLTHDTFI